MRSVVLFFSLHVEEVTPVVLWIATPKKAGARVGGTWSPYTGPRDPTCLRYGGAP